MSRPRLVLLSVLAALTVGAVAAASASALQWYYCEHVGTGGSYKNNDCSEAATSGEYELRLLPVGHLLKVEGGGESTTFIFKTKISGITIETQFKKVTSTGWIENVEINGAIRGLDLGTTESGEEVVTNPAGKGCQVNKLAVRGKSELVTEGGTVYDRLTPDPEGTIFIVLTISGCTGSASALNGTYDITGELYGKVINGTSSLEFSKGAPNNKLKFGGNAMEMTGEITGGVQGTTEGVEAL